MTEGITITIEGPPRSAKFFLAAEIGIYLSKKYGIQPTFKVDGTDTELSRRIQDSRRRYHAISGTIQRGVGLAFEVVEGTPQEDADAE